MVVTLAPPGAPLPVEDATRMAAALAGLPVAVEGELAWPDEGPPLLRGPGARLPLDAPSSAASLAGQRVVARGALRYEPPQAGYVLAAAEVRAA
jgi:hypothetical protein